MKILVAGAGHGGLAAAPDKYDPSAVKSWQDKVDRARLSVTRKPERKG